MTLSMDPTKQPRLLLTMPEHAAWRVRMIGQNLHEADIDAGVTLRVRALVDPTVEYTEWVEGIMLEDAPPGTVLRCVARQPRTSSAGLPVVFAHYQLLDGNQRAIEERAGAFYAVVHNRAEVVVRVRPPAAWSAYATALEPYLMSGAILWPDASDELLMTQLGMPSEA